MRFWERPGGGQRGSGEGGRRTLPRRTCRSRPLTLHAHTAALACFCELGEAVRPGGLLVLELPHPDELFSGELMGGEGQVRARGRGVGGACVRSGEASALPTAAPSDAAYPNR